MKQLTLGEALRDEGIARAASASDGWIAIMLQAIRSFAVGTEFSTDRLWDMGLPVREPRAMGAAIQQARRLGLIEPTGTYRKSERSECHARPVLVWRRI